MKIVRLALLFVILLVGMGAADTGGSSGAAGDSMLGVLREFGFPIFVSLWFMWRVEKRMDRFTDAIQNLLTAVTIMAKTVDGWHSAPSTARANTASESAKAG
jgi:YvrJ protein family